MRNCWLVLLLILNFRYAAAVPFIWEAARAPETYESGPAKATLIILKPEPAGFALLVLDGREFYKPIGSFLVKRELIRDETRWIAVNQESQPTLASSEVQWNEPHIKILSQNGQSFQFLKYSKAESEKINVDAIISHYLSRRQKVEAGQRTALIDAAQTRLQELTKTVNQECGSEFNIVIDQRKVGLEDARLYDLAEICRFALIGISEVCKLSEGKLAIGHSLKLVECGLDSKLSVSFESGKLKFLAERERGEQDVQVSEFLLNSNIGN